MNPLASLWTALLPLAQASPASPQQTSPVPMLVMMVGLFAVFYFLMIRPQRKRQREHTDMVSNLKKGDKIITRGGIHGIITLVRDREVVLKVDDNCKLTLSKSAVAVALPQEGEEGGKDKEAGKS